MTSDRRRSVAFHKAATYLLVGSLAVAGYIFFVFLAPAIEGEWGWGYVDITISTLYSPLLVTFGICSLIAVAILGWRAWLLHVGPWWRRQA